MPCPRSCRRRRGAGADGATGQRAGTGDRAIEGRAADEARPARRGRTPIPQSRRSTPRGVRQIGGVGGRSVATGARRTGAGEIAAARDVLGEARPMAVDNLGPGCGADALVITLGLAEALAEAGDTERASALLAEAAPRIAAMGPVGLPQGIAARTRAIIRLKQGGSPMLGARPTHRTDIPDARCAGRILPQILLRHACAGVWQPSPRPFPCAPRRAPRATSGAPSGR